MAELILFEKLKAKHRASRVAKTVKDPYFVLAFDDQARAYVQVQDGKGQEIAPPDYRQYSGSVRGVLKALDRISQDQAFNIQWGAPSEGYFLADHDHLLWSLSRCPQFVNGKGKLIKTQPGEGALFLEITGTKLLQGALILEHEGKRYEGPVILGETYVLVGTSLFEVKPLGENFTDLGWFNTQFPPAELEKYLSLVCTYQEKIGLRYEGFEVVDGGEKQAVNTLLFEKVDEDGALFLRVCLSVPGLPADFLEAFELDRVAFLNQVEKTITVYELAQDDLMGAIKTVTRLLNKTKRGLSEPAGFFQDGNNFIIQGPLARAFLERELSQLMKSYAVFGAEELKPYKIRVGSPKLKLRMEHGLDFLEGDAELEFQGQSVSLFEALSQFQKHGYVSLGDGTRGMLDRDYIAKLERLFQKKKKQVRVSFFDLPLVEELLQQPLEGKPFAKAREIYKQLGQLEKKRTSLPKLKGTLRPYQKQGFKWLRYLHDHGFGGCLADEMGLGKTLQTVALLAHIYPAEKKPTLIVMPKSLLFNWEREIVKFAPQLQAAVYYGSGRDWEQVKQAQIILTTYALVRNDVEILREIPFHAVVLDESQNIKNMLAQTTKAVLLLKARFRLALSGTPLENHLGELYSLFRFLNPAMFGSLEHFNRHYGNPIHKEQDKEAMGDLRRKIYPFILRRLKGEVLKDLPEKVEQVLYVDMDPDHQKFYERRRQFFQTAIHSEVGQKGIAKSQFFIFQALSELRQIAAIPELKTEDAIVSPKRELLMDHVSELTANGHKILIYANFLGVLSHLSEDLTARGIGHLTLTGATQNRGALVDRFQSDPRSKVFLLSLKAGGVGLNLTAADYVFIFDPWWNRAAENQAIDRAHRIGQRQTVFSYRLITRDTIEEKILQLQEMKAELFDQLITKDGASLKSLSEEDLDFMFGAN